MDELSELRSAIVAGCVTSLIAAIPLFFAVGIGGALVAAVSGAVVSAVAGTLMKRAAQKAQENLVAQTQISGILDSSQLDGTAPDMTELPFVRNGKKLAIVLSLVATLATGAIVAAVTGGTGINFYLGQSPVSQATNKDKDKPASTQTSTTSSTEQSDAGAWTTTTTHYDTYDTPEQSPSESAQTSEQTTANEGTQQPQQPEAPAQEPGQNTPQENTPAPTEQPSTEQPAQDVATIGTESQAQAE